MIKKSSIVAVLTLLCSTFVSASFIDDIRFGTTGLPFYDSYKVLIDFLLFFALFLGISMISLKGLYGKNNTNRNPVIAIALVIAIAFAIAALKAGLSAEFLAPFMHYFLFFGLVLLIYLGAVKLFGVSTTGGKVLTALLAILFAWLLVALVSGTLTGGSGDFPGSDMFSSVGTWFSNLGGGVSDAINKGQSKGDVGQNTDAKKDTQQKDGDKNKPVESDPDSGVGEICTDGIDNDDDGKIDENDEDCGGGEADVDEEGSDESDIYVRDKAWFMDPLVWAAAALFLLILLFAFWKMGGKRKESNAAQQFEELTTGENERTMQEAQNYEDELERRYGDE